MTRSIRVRPERRRAIGSRLHLAVVTASIARAGLGLRSSLHELERLGSRIGKPRDRPRNTTATRASARRRSMLSSSSYERSGAEIVNKVDDLPKSSHRLTTPQRTPTRTRTRHTRRERGAATQARAIVRPENEQQPSFGRSGCSSHARRRSSGRRTILARSSANLTIAATSSVSLTTAQKVYVRTHPRTTRGPRRPCFSLRVSSSKADRPRSLVVFPAVLLAAPRPPDRVRPARFLLIDEQRAAVG